MKLFNKTKLISIMSIFIFILVQIIGTFNPIKVSAQENNIMDLGFKPYHAVMNPDENTLYTIDKGNKKVVVIDLVTKEKSELTFDLVPERLYFENNKLYVALLITGHQYYSAEKEKGAIAIVNPKSLTIDKQFNVDIDPFDISVDKKNIIYISSGSNQWTTIKNYSTITEKEISSSYIRQLSYLQYNPTSNKVYTMTTDSSSGYITTFQPEQFNVLSGGQSYYDYDDLPSLIKLSPDGKYIFSGAGYAFKTSSDNTIDMQYSFKLENSFNDIAFSKDNFYTATNTGDIFQYSLESYRKTATINIGENISYIFSSKDSLVALYNDYNSGYIKFINKSDLTTITDTRYPGDLLDLVYSPINDKAYTLDKSFNKLLTINTKNNTMEKLINLNYTPSSLCVSNDGKYIYIANNDSKYAFTVINTETSELKDIAFNLPTNVSKSYERKILVNNNLIYLVPADISSTLYLFDSTTFENISYGEPITGVYNIAFTTDSKSMYVTALSTWLTSISRYDINGAEFSIADATNLPSSSILSCPIILNEENNTLILGDTSFNSNNLNYSTTPFPEYIYATNKTHTIASAKNKLYYLTLDVVGIFTDKQNVVGQFFSNNGTLYTLADNKINVTLPIPGDLNGDSVVDTLDLYCISKSYNATFDSPSYDFLLDLNHDKIIDIFDIVTFSKTLESTDNKTKAKSVKPQITPLNLDPISLL